jgi:hypothetical protein
MSVWFAGCDAVDTLVPATGSDPRDLDARYAWVLEQWNGGAAEGHALVALSWLLPADYRQEVFRVYARDASGGTYGLIATVTACADDVCRYADTNIVGGRSYDYYVATFDDRSGSEVGVSDALRVSVPVVPNLATPAAPSVVSLDGAAYLQWTPSTTFEHYYVVMEPDGGSIFLIGDTDSGSFLDDRPENGSRYRYYIAGVDAAGHVSSLSQGALAMPRPDYHSDIVYSHTHRPAESGFRFVSSETENPVVGGTSASAQWRLEEVGGVLRIQPLGPTTITDGVFTTQLACGPGSETDCVDVRTAPSSGQFSGNPVTVSTGHTYVLRVTGSDNQVHYGKLRVQGPGVNTSGERMIVFDWAYQLRPNEPSLNRIAR